MSEYLMSCNYFYRLDEIKALDLKNPGKEKIRPNCKNVGVWQELW